MITKVRGLSSNDLCCMWDVAEHTPRFHVRPACAQWHHLPV